MDVDSSNIITVKYGEKLDRRWMIYSQTKDAIYCFACRLFGVENTKFGFSDGVSDWKHLGNSLKPTSLCKP